jgi:hypothetical protein
MKFLRSSVTVLLLEREIGVAQHEIRRHVACTLLMP